MSDDLFVLPNRTPYKLNSKQEISLKHELFDDDAIILAKMGSQVELRSNIDHHRVVLNFPKMSYLGIWHMPKTDANYVCIEPWKSLPARKGVIEDITKQEDLVSLKAGETYQNVWDIEIIN